MSASVDTDVNSSVITCLAGAERCAGELLHPLRESRRQRCRTQFLRLVGPPVILVAVGDEAQCSVAEAQFHSWQHFEQLVSEHSYAYLAAFDVLLDQRCLLEPGDDAVDRGPELLAGVDQLESIAR